MGSASQPAEPGLDDDVGLEEPFLLQELFLQATSSEISEIFQTLGCIFSSFYRRIPKIPSILENLQIYRFPII